MFRPSFSKGSILKQNMLEAVRDYPYAALEIQYYDYGNGVISGFNITPKDEDGVFQVSPGILKDDGKIYLSSETLLIEQKNERHYVYLTIQNSNTDGGTNVDLKCRQTPESDENGFELFRYIKNAEIFKHKNIDEAFKDPMNRIDQRACKFAVIGGVTLHPNYYRLFAKEILKCANATSIDVAFAYQCLNGIRNIEVINQYFSGANTNSDILKKMKTVLDRLRKGKRVQDSETPKAPRKIIID